ncbi:MAG: glycosyltransferase family 39 protein [Legionellaceae bacterium]|nr:glycosyltransferase family 39 protein [Legionellaceae bacterium]
MLCQITRENKPTSLNLSLTSENAIDVVTNNTVLRQLVLGYFLLICVIAPFNLLAFDTYYYWDWSRHLALSYYDGPPLIAYIIRLTTLFMGNTLYALTFISVLFTAMTGYVVYKTASMFLNEKACYIATLLWLTSPLVTQDLLVQVTYDTPLTFFWACSLYYAISYIKKNNVKTLYCLGVAVGFLLLSKYTGIVLIGCLLFFISSTNYIRLLKNQHFYGAILLALLMFSPVLIWNIQHDWVSIDYQMNAHHTDRHFKFWLVLLQNFAYKILPSINVMILAPFLLIKQRESENSVIIRLLIIIAIGFLGFYTLLAMTTDFRVTWLAQYVLMSSLLMGFGLQQYQKKLRGMMYAYIGVNILISILILLNTCLHFVPSNNYTDYKLIQQFNKDYPEQSELVVTSGWIVARHLFFLKAKPLIYTIDCTYKQNAYQFWRAELDRQIANNTKDVWFMDFNDEKACVERHFKYCERQPSAAISTRQLFVYRCKFIN